MSLHYLLWILIGMILHHIIPSLISYIIIVLIFLTVLPGPSSRSTTSNNELSLHRSSLSYHFSPWTTSLISSLSCTHGCNNLSLNHSFDLMSSLIDYIFMKSLDKCVVIIINILMLLQDINRIHDEKYHPCPSMIGLDNILASPQHKLVHVLSCILNSLLSSLYCVLPWSICWKYALEAIINRLLLYFLVHDNCLLSMLELYW